MLAGSRRRKRIYSGDGKVDLETRLLGCLELEHCPVYAALNPYRHIVDAQLFGKESLYLEKQACP